MDKESGLADMRVAISARSNATRLGLTTMLASQPEIRIVWRLSHTDPLHIVAGHSLSKCKRVVRKSSIVCHCSPARMRLVQAQTVSNWFWR